MDSKVSVLLNGGVDTQSESEFASPVVGQGSSPTLVTSRNTRLSTQPGTCDRAPAVTRQTTAIAAGEPCFGVVPEGRLRRSLVLATPERRNRVIAEDGASANGTGVIQDVRGRGAPSAYIPAQITDAGQIPGAQAAGDVAVCYNPTLDQVWYAWASDVSVESGVDPLFGVWVCAVNEAGALLLPATRLPGFGTTTEPAFLKVGLTAHGATGVAVWWSAFDGIDPDPKIYSSTLTLSGTALVDGTKTQRAADQDSGWDVIGYDATYAFLACLNEADLTQGIIYKINMLTGARTSVAVTGASLVPSSPCAIHYESLPVGHRVVAAFSSPSANTVTWIITDQNLGVVVPSTTQTDTNGELAVKFLVTASIGTSAAVLAVSSNTDNWSDQTLASPELGQWIDFTILNHGGGGVQPLERMRYAALQNGGAQIRPTATEVYPIFFAARSYGVTSGDTYLPGGEDYVADPSVIGYIVGPTFNSDPVAVVTPVARFGCVRGNQAPAHTARTGYMPGGSCPTVGTDRVITAYRELQFGVDPLYVTNLEARFVELDFGVDQPSVAIDKDGASFVAAALPVQWDGVEVVEVGGPLHMPMLLAFTDTTLDVSVPIQPAGVYQLSAIYQWTDAAGLTHRSTPSAVQVVTCDGAADQLAALVTLPDSIRAGILNIPVDVVLYCTEANGASFHRVNERFSYDAGMVRFEVGTIDGGNPTIYSNGAAGSELTPQPPPPLKDIVIVGSRAWGVDAEVPTRIVYSKLRVAGVGFEFFPAGELLVPSGAGEIVAIQEWAGSVVVFTEHAIYQIADGGPSNQIGGGGSFGSPYRVADVGCSERHSVLRTPVGIFFRQPNGVMAVFSGGVQPLPGVRIPTGIVGAYMLENGDEACFVAYNTALTAHQVYAYNYSLKRWTTWDLVSNGAQVTAGVVVPSALGRSNALLYDLTSGYINRVVGDERHASVNMSWETDWVVLDGDFQTRVLLREVVLNGKRLGAHSITIDIFTDYNSVTPSTTRTWTDGMLSPLATEGRYTIRATPQVQVTRAMKIRITETRSGSVDAFRPRSLTVVFAVDGLLNETSFLVGSRQ